MVKRRGDERSFGNHMNWERGDERIFSTTLLRGKVIFLLPYSL
jgi:hypothetical protein